MTGTGQDMPPTGGFGPILYRRHLPKRGPPGWVLLTGAFGVIFTGLYLRSQGVHINRELEREKRQERLMLYPLLLAESDLIYLERSRISRDLERSVMKDVPGWEVGKKIYNTERFIPDPFFTQDLFHQA